MKRFFFQSILLFVFIFNAQIVWAVKPVAPLRVTIQADQVPAANQDLVLKITVKSFVDIADLRLQIILPAGVSVVHGLLQEPISIAHGESLQRTLSVHLPGTLQGTIYVTAKAYRDGEHFFTVRDLLVLGEAAEQKKSSRQLSEQENVIHRQRNDEMLKEYILPEK